MTKPTEEWVSKPADAEIYDDAFWIQSHRWGTVSSIGKGGEKIITSLTKEVCISATRFHLKFLQEKKNEIFQKGSLVSS